MRMGPRELAKCECMSILDRWAALLKCVLNRRIKIRPEKGRK